ncbi:uncharacterized protein LOC112347958 [Selaginella moellendorffii]|uniref:uncharacterized protein LOC112347958 n=1 Tax=Selaginella moellendorffii TaxID=88036 RepID=UPI000D1C356D|nr:uncharacterized protein LOC112347958 [Selaginella moellendorffii]|eukprot:XP_024535526.1 uncharacterized protein LOC112347958 [Selaginella moellendorffii]
MAELHSRAFRADSSAAKRVTIGLPFLAIAAFTILVIGHLVKRRNPGGKRLGGANNTTGQHAPEENGDGVADDDDTETQCLEIPGSIEELRARRIRAMEKRLARGSKSNDPGSARLTPLGTMLAISRKIDELEKQVASFLDSSSQVQQHRCEELVENLKSLQIEIDAVSSDEAVREHRKIQSCRVESLMQELQHSKQ